MNQTWQRRSGPNGVAGCFSWDSPRGKTVNSPDPAPLHEEEPEDLNSSQTGAGSKPATPENDKEKYGIKVDVKVGDKKEGLDRDHIYVDDKKIYRVWRSPDLYGDRGDETSARSGSDNSFELIYSNGDEDGVKERMVFSDDTQKLKVQIQNSNTGADTRNEPEEKMRTLSVTGQAVAGSDVAHVTPTLNDESPNKINKVFR